MSDLFSLPFVADEHGTSKDAAEAALPHAGTQLEIVWVAILRHGPVSDHDIVELTGIRLATVCARRHELYRRGLIRTYGTKPGPYGTANQVWGTND